MRAGHLIIREFDARMNIGGTTTYTITRSGESPEFRIRDRWCFRYTDVDTWIDKQIGSAYVTQVVTQREEDP